jgi:hypothetical protein
MGINCAIIVPEIKTEVFLKSSELRKWLTKDLYAFFK